MADATMANLLTGLVTIIENGLGDDISPVVKYRMETVVKMIEPMFNMVEPFIASRVDLKDALEAVADVEQAFTNLEEAVAKFKVVFGKKEEAPASAPTETIKDDEQTSVPLA